MRKKIIFILLGLAISAMAQTYKGPVRFYKARIDTPWIGTHDRKSFFDRLGPDNLIRSNIIGDTAIKNINIDMLNLFAAMKDSIEKALLDSLNSNGLIRGNSGIEGINTSGVGVNGIATSGPALKGTSTSGFGVNGISTFGIGIYGVSIDSFGVYGISTTDDGVKGYSTDQNGVSGQSINNAGVRGYGATNGGVIGISVSNAGVFGQSTSYRGVFGQSTSDDGAYGESTNGYGIHGKSTNSRAGFFEGPVWSTGKMTTEDSAYAALGVRADGQSKFEDIAFNFPKDSILYWKNHGLSANFKGIWWKDATTQDLFVLRFDTLGLQMWRLARSLGRTDWIKGFDFGYINNGVGHVIHDYLIIDGTDPYPTTNPTWPGSGMLSIHSDLSTQSQNIIDMRQNINENFMSFYDKNNNRVFWIDSLGQLCPINSTTYLNINGKLKVMAGTIQGIAATEYIDLNNVNGVYLVSNGSYIRCAPADNIIMVRNNVNKLTITGTGFDVADPIILTNATAAGTAEFCTNASKDTVTISGATSSSLYQFSWTSDPGTPGAVYYTAYSGGVYFYTKSATTGNPTYSWTRWEKN